MGKKYQRRVSELIHRKITQLLMVESNDPRLSTITITDVSINQDTTRAEVYYSLIGSPEEQKEMQSVLNSAAGWLRAQLAPTLRLRKIPELVFVYDPSLEHGDHIEAILHQLHEEELEEDDNTGDIEASSSLPKSE